LMFDVSKKVDESQKVGPAKLLKLTDNGLNCTELLFKKTALNPNSTLDTLVIRLAEFSPQSDLLAVVSLDSMPSLFDKDGVLTTVFPTDAATIQGLKWSSDGQFLLFEKEKSVEIWQRNGQKMGEILLPDQLFQARFLIDNQSIVTTCLDLTTIVWSLNGQKKYTLETKEKYATIDVSPDGKWLIAGTYLTHKVHRFRTDGTGKPTVCFDPSVSDKEGDREVHIRGVNFLPDSRRALVWTELGSLFLINTDSLVMPKRPLSTALRNMFVSPNRAKMLLSTSEGFELWTTDGHRLYQNEQSVFAQASFTEKADYFVLSGFHEKINQGIGAVSFGNYSTLWQSAETIMNLLNQQLYRLYSLEERKQLGLD
jgi:WD40 repeat protein